MKRSPVRWLKPAEEDGGAYPNEEERTDLAERAPESPAQRAVDHLSERVEDTIPPVEANSSWPSGPRPSHPDTPKIHGSSRGALTIWAERASIARGIEPKFPGADNLQLIDSDLIFQILKAPGTGNDSMSRAVRRGAEWTSAR